MPSVLAISVNYRTPRLALRCLESLARERTEDCRLSAIVVDNASGDGSAAAIRDGVERKGWSDWARVLESPVNGGFGAGNNLALRQTLNSGSPPDLVLLVNPDAALLPGAIGKMA